MFQCNLGILGSTGDILVCILLIISCTWIDKRFIKSFNQAYNFINLQGTDADVSD